VKETIENYTVSAKNITQLKILTYDHTVEFSLSQRCTIAIIHTTFKTRKKNEFLNHNYKTANMINNNINNNKKINLFPMILLHFLLTPTNFPKNPYEVKIK
jgi:hypothetical protein